MVVERQHIFADMNHGSLFSGIGGFDLAAYWMGWNNIFQCEKDEYALRILSKNFPHTKRHEDVKCTDFSIYRGLVDIVTGGFPCQPFSTAGKQKGTDDSRYLWPYMLRAIQQIKPSYVVAENVRGLVSWNEGLVFEQVCTDLEFEGYQVIPFILPACAVNAPHRRDRVWFVAYSNMYNGFDVCRPEASEWGEIKEQYESGHLGGGGLFTNTKCSGQQGPGRTEKPFYKATHGNGEASWTNNDGGWATQPPVCGANDGISNRVDRLKGLGNAIVPQVAYNIFKCIEKATC